MTIDDIRCGIPFPHWDEAIQNRLEQDARERPDFPLFRNHDQFRLGAAAGAAGELDGSETTSSFRYGFDWANRFALEHNLWEAWHRAYLEVVDKRPIGRSQEGGVRYYAGRDHLPPTPLDYPPVHALIWRSLHAMQGSVMRWSIHRELGSQGEEFARAVSAEFSTCSSADHQTWHGVGYGCEKYNRGGGKTSKYIYYDRSSDHSINDHIVIAGDRLIDLCSQILEIGASQLTMI